MVRTPAAAGRRDLQPGAGAALLAADPCAGDRPDRVAGDLVAGDVAQRVRVRLAVAHRRRLARRQCPRQCHRRRAPFERNPPAADPTAVLPGYEDRVRRRHRGRIELLVERHGQHRPVDLGTHEPRRGPVPGHVDYRPPGERRHRVTRPIPQRTGAGGRRPVAHRHRLPGEHGPVQRHRRHRLAQRHCAAARDHAHRAVRRRARDGERAARRARLSIQLLVEGHRQPLAVHHRAREVGRCPVARGRLRRGGDLRAQEGKLPYLVPGEIPQRLRAGSVDQSHESVVDRSQGRGPVQPQVSAGDRNLSERHGDMVELEDEVGLRRRRRGVQWLAEQHMAA